MMVSLAMSVVLFLGIISGLVIYHFVFKFGLRIGEAKRLNEDLVNIIEEEKPFDQENTT